MITGIGIDVVQNDRVRRSIERFGDRFLHRIYTEGEIEYCKKTAHPEIHYAARFAAKEAALKALGTGFAGRIKWTDVEVVRPSSGKPELLLHAEALALAAAAGAKRYFVSITHDQLVSCAVVVLEG